MERVYTYKSCHHCGTERPLSDYHRNKNTRDGHATWCKACRREYQRTYMQIKKQRNRPRGSLSEAGQKRCGGCLKTLPQESFSKNRRAQDGFDYYCKRCFRNLAYWRNNPDRYRAANNARRVRRLNNGGSHTAEEWAAVCAANEHRCNHCGCVPTTLTRDHIVPLALGGTDDIENIQPLCRSCNCRKRDRFIG